MTSQLVNMTSLSSFFDAALFLLSIVVIGRNFMWVTSLVLELWQFTFIRDAPETVTGDWRLGWVRDTKFGIDVSSNMLLNAAKCQGHSFYHFWVIKGKPTGNYSPPFTNPPRLGLIILVLRYYMVTISFEVIFLWNGMYVIFIYL